MSEAILTCSEHFTDFALNELRRQHPDVTLLERVTPQHLRLKTPGTFQNLVRPWRHLLPIYLHHLFPIQRTFALTGTAQDFALLRSHAQAVCRDKPAVQVWIEGVYAYSSVAIEQSLAPGQTRASASQTRRDTLFVLLANGMCMIGVVCASDWIAGASFALPYFDEPVPNRAGLKLLESLNTFNMRVRPGEHALDLGAAPGAWTEVLRRRGMQITAVAPRAMYDWLQGDPQVRSFYLTAEEYLAQCDTTYDLLLNDMKLDGQDSARLMVDYAAHLRPNGFALMTLKLTMRNPRRVMDHTYRLLRKAYRIVRVRHLVSNRKEVTLFLQRKE